LQMLIGYHHFVQQKKTMKKTTALGIGKHSLMTGLCHCTVYRQDYAIYMMLTSEQTI